MDKVPVNGPWSDTIVYESPILSKQPRIQNQNEPARGEQPRQLVTRTLNCKDVSNEELVAASSKYLDYNSTVAELRSLKQRMRETESELRDTRNSKNSLLRKVSEQRREILEYRQSEVSLTKLVDSLRSENFNQKKQIQSLKRKFSETKAKIRLLYDECSNDADVDECRAQTVQENRMFVATSVDDVMDIDTSTDLREATHESSVGNLIGCPRRTQAKALDKLSETIDLVVDRYRSETPIPVAHRETVEGWVRERLRSLLVAHPTLGARELRHVAESISCLRPKVQMMSNRQLSNLVSAFRKKFNLHLVDTKMNTTMPSTSDGRRRASPFPYGGLALDV